MDTRVLSPDTLSRRRFLRQSFAFSALASLNSISGLADPLPSISAAPAPGTADLLMIGDWGYDNDHTGQSQVAAGMRRYTRQTSLRPQALLMLGDNWYGELAGGARSSRWQTQFERMYPADEFSGPAYAILGNHDYQRWPESKVDSELEYSRLGRTRWTMPARWYRFEFPTKNPLITFLALDSNMPFKDGTYEHGRDFTLTSQQQAEQLAWLEAQLKLPRTTPFLVAMGHYPIYSDGPQEITLY